MTLQWIIPLGLAATAAADGVAARAGGHELKASELGAWLGDAPAESLHAMRLDPAVLAETARGILVHQLLNDEAHRSGWTENPANRAALDRRMVRATAEQYLAALAAPAPDWPDEEQLRQVYQERAAEWTAPRRLHLRQIFLTRPADGSALAAKERELRRIVAMLAKPDADFAAIARAHSEDPASAGHGGDLGWLAEPLIEPAIRKAVESIHPGETTPPLVLREGWHILQLVAREEPRPFTLEEARPRLTTILREEKSLLETRSIIARLLSENPLEFDESLLSELISDTPVRP